MEYIAIAKNIKISPRKVRLVADYVKKQKLPVAFSMLSLMTQRSAGPIKKALDSAVANATNNFAAKKDDLSIRDIIVGEAVTAKRFHFAGRGRSRPYQRRSSHIRVILMDNKVKTSSTAAAKPGENAQIEAVTKSSESKSKEKAGKEKK